MNRVGTMVPMRHGTQTIPCSYLFCSHCPLSHFCCLFIIISFLAKWIFRLGGHGGTRTPLPLGLFERFAYPPLAPTYFPLLQHCVLCSSGRMNTLARSGSIGLPEMSYCPPKHALGGLHLRPEQIVQSCPRHLLGYVAKPYSRGLSPRQTSAQLFLGIIATGHSDDLCRICIHGGSSKLLGGEPKLPIRILHCGSVERIVHRSNKSSSRHK